MAPQAFATLDSRQAGGSATAGIRKDSLKRARLASPPRGIIRAGVPTMKQIGSIQILRAVAALMIVLSHAQDDALNQAVKAGVAFARTDALPWVAGVDLFFVISGFIMVHASGRLFATKGAAGAFIGRRLIRIVPLYWLITAITLVVLGIAAWRGKQAFPGLEEIASSLGFVPFARPGDGQPRPLAAQGWTLNYEMFFYVVFALFVGLRREVAVAGVAAALMLVVALGVAFRPTGTALAFWSDPIVLEFAIGMGLALIWHHGFRLPRWLAFLLGAVGLAVLALDLDGMNEIANFAVDPNGFGRLAACGLPMALLFGAIVLAEPAFSSRSRWGSFMALLGDASYALYLFHPLVVVLARKAYLALGLAHPLGIWPLVAADIPLAAALALAIHAAIEKPAGATLQAWFRNKVGRPASAQPGRPLPIARVDLLEAGPRGYDP